MEMTEKWLGEIGGWAALKAARSLVSAGAVRDAARDGETVRGTVGGGKIKHRAGLRVKSRSDVENLCTCPVARGRGVMCEHSLAVALAVISGALVKKEVLIAQCSVPSVVSGPQGKFTVFISDDALTAMETRGRASAFLKWEAGGETVEARLGSWLAGQGLPCATTPLTLDRASLGGLLRALGEHPRVFRGKPRDVDAESRVVVAAETMRLPLTVTSDDGESVMMRLASASITPVFAEEKSTARWWWCDETRTVFRTESSGDAGMLLNQLAAMRGPVPGTMQWLVRAMPALDDAFLPSLEGPLLSRLRVLPAPCAFEMQLDGSAQVAEIRIAVVFGDKRWDVAAKSADEFFPIRDAASSHLFYARDAAAERAAMAALEKEGFTAVPDGRWRLQGADKVLRFFASVLPRLQEKYRVIESERWLTCTRGWMRVRPQVTPASDAGDDWLHLGLGYTAADGFRVSRQDVMQMIRAGRGALPAKGGARYVIDAEACDAFEESLRDVDVEMLAEGARVRRVYLDYLTRREGSSREMRAWSAIKPELGTLAERLREYQAEGVRWLDAIARAGMGGLLADDMGLGKTVQAIAMMKLLRARERGQVLVICPKSLLGNWKDELTRFAPELSVAIWSGPDRKQRAEEMKKADVLITTFQLASIDAAFLQETRYLAVVVDEASYIRNPDTEAAKALCQLQAGTRIALSGTPLENGVRDLWSIFAFLAPRYLGSRAVFRERFETPMRDVGSEAGRAAASRLKRLIAPFFLRRSKAQVLKELPERIEQVIWCDLSPMQSEVYRRVIEEGRDEIRQARRRSGASARMTMLTVLLRLRQVCCDLRLAALPKKMTDGADAADLSCKSAAWLERVNEVINDGGKVIIFSQFVKHLRFVRDVIEAEKLGFAYLDGSTTDRAGEVRKFQGEPDCRVFLISLRAGGYGLNLTAANHVILLDPWWNPAVEAQAIDRAHRMGQTRTVTAARIVTRGTIEEKILALQSKKRGLVESVVSDSDPMMEGLRDADLESLLE